MAQDLVRCMWYIWMVYSELLIVRDEAVQYWADKQAYLPVRCLCGRSPCVSVGGALRVFWELGSRRHACLVTACVI